MTALIDTPEGRKIFRLLLAVVFALGLGVGSFTMWALLAAFRDKRAEIDR